LSDKAVQIPQCFRFFSTTRRHQTSGAMAVHETYRQN
jgi:hypothetical protein